MSIEKRDPKSSAKHIFDIFGIADKICKVRSMFFFTQKLYCQVRGLQSLNIKSNISYVRCRHRGSTFSYYSWV